jgi:hypothetical protein
MDEMMNAQIETASYLNRVCPACGERFARHNPDDLDDGVCGFTGTLLDEVELLHPLTLLGKTVGYDPQDVERRARASEFYREDPDGGTPARHNVRINAHFAAWLADENSAGRFPTIEEAGRQYDEKYC